MAEKQISNGTVIMLCKCHSEFQDKEYGKFRRLFNHGKSKGGEEGGRKVDARCSVCGNEVLGVRV